MTFRSKLILAFTMAAVALGALRAAAGGETGVDVTLEGSAGRFGGGAGGQSLHGLAIGHIDWERPPIVGDESRFTLRSHASALLLQGRGPTSRYLGDFLSASNIEGEPGVRLYSWWLEAGLRGWSFRAGALLADEEFAVTEAGAGLVNSAFGWPAHLSANALNAGPSYSYAAPGLRAERRWRNGAAWRLGVYDGDSLDSPDGDPTVNRRGWHYRVGGDQGAFVISEAEFAPVAGVGCKVGGWLHTANLPDLASAGRNHPRNFGAYAGMEFALIGEAGQPGQVRAFVRAGSAPADRNAVSWAADGGIAWTGPLPGRPADSLSLGVAQARLGGPFADEASAADPAQPRLDFERVVELAYTLAVSERLSLQPDLQYIVHPGGSSARRPALVLLLLLNASY